MTELDLSKFLQDTEVRWVKDNDDTWVLLAWIEFYDLPKFVTLIEGYILHNLGIDCNLQWKCVCIDLTSICEYFGIDPERIHPF